MYTRLIVFLNTSHCRYEISNGFDSAMVNPDSECVADDLFTVPSSLFAKLVFVLMFPMKYLIYLTVPDVRKPGYESRALVSIGMSVLWLAAQSYVLIVSLTMIGQWLGIRGRIMGLTVGELCHDLVVVTSVVFH